MSKAILVIDMPEGCNKCFALVNKGDRVVCNITQEYTTNLSKTKRQRMDKCPLRGAPNPMWSFCETDDYMDGYNDCLKEILRGSI